MLDSSESDIEFEASIDLEGKPKDEVHLLNMTCQIFFHFVCYTKRWQLFYFYASTKKTFFKVEDWCLRKVMFKIIITLVEVV